MTLVANAEDPLGDHGRGIQGVIFGGEVDVAPLEQGIFLIEGLELLAGLRDP